MKFFDRLKEGSSQAALVGMAALFLPQVSQFIPDLVSGVAMTGAAVSGIYAFFKADR